MLKSPALEYPGLNPLAKPVRIHNIFAMERLRDQIICGDCIEILGGIKNTFADLIFADPPFNIGYKYDKYYDKVKSKNYIAWTKAWMAACKGGFEASRLVLYRDR